MKEEKRKILQQLYRTACNNYLEAFAEKHGLNIEDCDWVGNDPGGVASVGDFYIDMQTIIDDIDRNAPDGEFFRWYDYQLECAVLELPSCNFRSWLMGCPRHSDETFERLRKLRKDVNDARQLLEQAIAEEKGKLF